jgi:hypothetical protein
MYRRDPGLFKHTNEHASMMCSATYEPKPLQNADDELADIVERGHRAIMNIKGGFSKMLQDASTLIRNGFVVFEVQWADADGFKYPYSLGFRDQSGVEYWLFDDRQGALIGADFRVTNGGYHTSYTLPHGDTYETARLLLMNIGATGNNVEGVPAYRPVAGLLKLKLTLLTLFGISWSKHGLPIAVVMTDLVDATIAEYGTAQQAEHKGSVQKLLNRLRDMRARIAPAFEVPVGKKVEYLAPQNQMPDLKPMLEYIDFSIALAFSNEGALLGTQTGSYALAISKESTLARGGVAYAQRVCAGLDQLMRWIVLFNYSKAAELVEWPSYGFRFAGSQDNSRWTADVAKGLPLVADMPPEVRRMFAAGLGLSSNAFDDVPSNAAPDAPAEAPITTEVPDGLE